MSCEASRTKPRASNTSCAPAKEAILFLKAPFSQLMRWNLGSTGLSTMFLM
eukprot:CAMPEP_0195035616 /NCGR_PEP_ID=MMETSP0326_2-20130528/70671_1 /TAXON_ID=2866 ORGANISM="Crypthecodinium cohnii, Strain Seligo" /NCGR_SAMPLE_ID=MMETSP0326_2 /ASSEMBLY_ACC=CAM_ASM_000348 /LENGTH=50 /DNA_ID=CAMNT_0040060867 /DNA_START=473 /DNA_END=625 /DNA_ORIENTATION=-